MLASWSYNQVCLIWQVCLLVKYNIKVKTVCVCVIPYKGMCNVNNVLLPVKKLILIYLWCTCWHHEFEMTESAFSGMTTMIQILRDFKSILDLYYRVKNSPRLICRVDLFVSLYSGQISTFSSPDWPHIYMIYGKYESDKETPVILPIVCTLCWKTDCLPPPSNNNMSFSAKWFNETALIS